MPITVEALPAMSAVGELLELNAGLPVLERCVGVPWVLEAPAG